MEQIKDDLDVLYSSQSEAQFRVNVDQFKTKWSFKFAPYWKYLELTWLKAHSPDEWAPYLIGRSKLGTGSLEGWHNRMKTLTPHLQESKKKDKINSQIKFQKKSTLHINTITSENNSQALILLDEPPAQEIVISEPTPKIDTNTASNQISEGSAASKVSEQIDLQPIQHNHEAITVTEINEQQTASTQCVKCNNNKINKECSLKMCQTCCGSISTPCKVSNHNLFKNAKFSGIHIKSNPTNPDPKTYLINRITESSFNIFS